MSDGEVIVNEQREFIASSKGLVATTSFDRMSCMNLLRSIRTHSLSTYQTWALRWAIKQLSGIDEAEITTRTIPYDEG